MKRLRHRAREPWEGVGESVFIGLIILAAIAFVLAIIDTGGF